MTKVVQFPTLPVGARATTQLLNALYKRDLPQAPATPPSEADMVDDKGNVLLAGVRAVATWRAMHEFNCAADIGHPEPYSVFYDREYKSAMDTATVIGSLRKLRIKHDALSAEEKRIRELETELHKAENGLAMPYDHGRVVWLRDELTKARGVAQFPYAQE